MKKKLRLSPEEITALIAVAASLDTNLFYKVAPEVLAVIYKCKAATTTTDSIVHVPAWEIRD